MATGPQPDLKNGDADSRPGDHKALVDVERRSARKVLYNARGAVGKDVISVLRNEQQKARPVRAFLV